MNEKLITLIFSSSTALGIAIAAILGLLQGWNTLQDRLLKQNVEKAKQTSVGEAAIEKLVNSHTKVTMDIKEIQEDVRSIEKDLLEEKKSLQKRLDGLRDHFDEMTKDFIKIINSK